MASDSNKKDEKKKKYPDADPLNKTVKEYSRSAAGLAAPRASELRPLPVLITTTNYLIRYNYNEKSIFSFFLHIFVFITFLIVSIKNTCLYLSRLALFEKGTSSNWNTVYDFVADRLRAVRKDLIIQGLHNLDVLPVLEPMVIFHIYSGYR